jgi:hypothetical protein
MFGKKPENFTQKTSATVSVQTMPADFYGGMNPIIKFKKVEKEIVLDSRPKLTSSEKKMLDKSTAVGASDPLHAVNIFTNKKRSLIFFGILFVVAIVGAGGYYYFQSKIQARVAVPNPPKIEVAPVITESAIVPTNTEAVVIATDTAPKFLPEAPIDFPSYLLGDSPDLDRDNITDLAEELFGTDPSNPDTDVDGYNDGHEVFYLYNPSGKEPIRLVESQFVKEYKNSNFGYSILYPVTWALGLVDVQEREVLFSTLTGENIELRTFDLAPQQTFSDWFTQWGAQQNYQNLLDFQTRFLETGKSRNDSLVYYFFDNNHVYVMLYHTTDSSVVNYRSVMVMMARSFKSAQFIIPDNISAPVSSTFPAEMPATTGSQNTASSDL